MGVPFEEGKGKSASTVEECLPLPLAAGEETIGDHAKTCKSVSFRDWLYGPLDASVHITVFWRTVTNRTTLGTPAMQIR
jgi:hypothetical protein